MGISIARLHSQVQGSGIRGQGSGSSRDNERQPRFRELKFCHVRGRGKDLHTRDRVFAPAWRVRQSAWPSALFSDAQHVARSDLRPMPWLGKPADPIAQDRSFVRADRLQHLKPRLVHRIERQRELKARLGRRLELPCPFQRLFALELGAVALKTHWQCLGQRCRPVQSGPMQSSTASSAERFGASPFELAAFETNPFAISRLQIARRILQHTEGVYADPVTG
jgi:hypothetical protein